MKKNFVDPIIAKMTPEQKAALIAHLRSIPDDSDVFPGVLGNKSAATLLKPLRRWKPAARKSTTRKAAKARA